MTAGGMSYSADSHGREPILGPRTIYSRYEEVDVICAPDDTHADLAGMMREAREEVEGVGASV
jgi:hypothetical protein